MIALGLKSTKFARVGQYIGAITQLVSNAATFTQAAISGLENAKAIFRNAKSGKLLSIDTASNVAALGLNLFTTIVSGKGAVTSGKNIKKMIGTDVGNKWGNKANNKPLLECNLQFFGDKSGSTTIIPDKAKDIAKQVKSNNGAPPKGYKGGRMYKNISLEEGAQKLPEGVNYREYDINPYVKGQNRGKERIVIVDDNSVWYTNDHYYTFTQIE